MFNSNYASVPLVASLDGGNGGNGNNNGWGDMGAWWIIIFVLFFAFGGWGRGYGNSGSDGGGVTYLNSALTREDLCSEMSFQDVKRGVQNIDDNVNVGFANLNSTICNQQYDTARMLNTLGTTVMQGFNASNIAQLQGQNAIQTQLAQCCCDTREAIQANTTQGVMNTNAIQNQIQQCCCANEKDLMQLNYNLATQNCNTLQAIDKVGDRIIDYLAADKAQALRDENQALRLAASQQAQNNYLISHLNPTPVPAYPAASPCGLGNWSPAVLANGYGYNNGFGCGVA